jgi:transcriptional regulator with XRE-family HTH domain
VASDIAILLHNAREERGLSQEAAARLAGLQQQAVSRLERPGAKPQIATIRKYLAALGYTASSSTSSIWRLAKLRSRCRYHRQTQNAPPERTIWGLTGRAQRTLIATIADNSPRPAESPIHARNS